MAKTSSSLPAGGNLFHNTLMGLNDGDFQHLTMLEKANLEFITNKQDSLAIDGTGTKYPTVDAVNDAIISGATPDATSTIKGKLKLTNDLGGTADLPLINVKTLNSISIKGSGDLIIDKTFVGLGNVNNTSDLNKPISTATQTALDLKENKSEKNQINGYAGLDGSGKIFSNQLPSLAITDTFVVNSQAAMLALSFAEVGDIAVRTDLNKTFILKGSNYSVLSEWQELLSPTDSVFSVFGRTGTVTANPGDYDTSLIPDTLNRRYVTDANLITIGNQSGVNTGDNSVNTNSNAYADSKVEDLLIDGVINKAPSQNVVFDALDIKTGNSAGAVQGFAITNNSNGTVNIASGIAYLRATNDQYAPLLKYTIPAVTNLSLTDNTNNYILVDYNGGSPSITVTTNSATINTETNSLLAVISRVGTTLDYLSLVGQNNDANAKIRVRFLNQEGIRRANGVTIGFINRNLTLTAGTLFSGLIRINSPAFNTVSSDTFTYVYNNGAVWTRVTGQTQINNTQYNNSGVLTTMPINDFRVDYIYLLPNNPSKLYVVYGNTTYNNITLARNAPAPTALPTELQVIGLLVGRQIIQRNAAVISEVTSAFADVFTNTGVPEHNALAGLQGGATNDYQHLTTVEKTLALTPTLQKAYDNSTNPKITTTTPLGAVTIKRGSASDTDSILDILNGAGASVTAVTGVGNLYSPGVFSENTTTLTPTVSGQAARISYINSLKATQPTKLVIYFHGAGDTQNEPFTEPESKYVIDELLSKGYIVAASNAHGNNWGNQASQDDYLALYNYINGLYNISEVIYIGHSMGGLSSLSMLANNTIPKTTAWYGIFPVTNLNEAYFVETGFVASIEAAYGFSGGANYAVATAGYDPQLRTTALYAGRRYTMTASPSDLVIFKTTNSDLFNSKLVTGQISSSVITATGNHGDISHFIPKSVSNFISNAVVNTLNPIGKVNITTGLSGNTTNIATLPINTISFANRGVATSSPTIVGKSDNSAGLILIAATNNSSASADLTLDIRENDDTDFSTLNALGFRFSRFGTPLIDIQRDGKTGFGITTPTTQIDVATSNPSVLTDNITLRSNSQLVGTEIGIFFSPSSATGNIRGSRISSANDGSNNTDLRFYTGVGASITRKMTIFNTGGVSIGNTTDLGAGTLNVTGNVTTISATTANHAVIKSQLDALVPTGRKLYKALITQTSTGAPTVTVLFNTIGAIVWTRTTTGSYVGTLASAFTANKTMCFINNTSAGFTIFQQATANTVTLVTQDITGTNLDGKITNASITIEVYP